MIRKILIANRGEIAVRIIRACKELGISTVAVYSEQDKDAMHTQLADEAICIGSGKSKESYLNSTNILSAAVATKSNAIHPGFGFLSENATFAAMCEACNIKFIGPRSETIDLLGNKSMAREVMTRAKVPVIPGSKGIIETFEKAKSEAKRIGYPIMIKASSGGGGKGIRLVRKEDELENAFYTAKSEGATNFGDDSVYMEKFIENPRHIEFQIIADNYGNVIHLGERDCSIQRRNQKVLEEAPAKVLTEELREKMGIAAINGAKAAGYVNAGTMEFLLDKHGNFYFMEMNTRIQVEHPVTEMITSVDIVKEQINIANNNKLSFSQDDVVLRGHAIECRINAEMPDKNFAPCPGKITFLNIPGGNGVRVDTAVYSGYTIPPLYDSMIAKLIVHGKNRDEAIHKMIRALEEFVIEGIESNIDFQFDILNNDVFKSGNFDTSFINQEFNM
ncbi:MAG: acetyl-CoA carboxylase biotin carboxylase subunit [Sarcina ventriculi]|uniref:Biotin carboxylase n=1 Tax=Sarcina ventriculi TaxID=1267 RepID=A0ABM9UJV4_SARVE|nr:acetyl-CoA carboxylase biotin carboxylase subunit [Sarcina ventriculi]MDO4402917.1 acetyl-CoA carboxylase biotin carboxylase subunit [Clostridiaceae bacterium]MBU5321902.1 acetyl-CoA carboxylase biotin carboxylase subunit [Sarcina ventriculi]MCI5637367.1 acetyl-CoA carboxylase biotin carboxylase subunit [Sarcina ventriculi]MDD7372920.1 acetyl-CoA carboxylase biotin carboxylase subunit [Sarcina ventriculi]MDY7063382.1 acetyl-CoA carboxylase biotin carboxylase subunit [Sarcina ventriculi]